jgi:hypothetical protein
MLWVPISIRARCTTLCYKVCQWLATGRWFSPGPPVSSTNKTDRRDIAEILLKGAVSTIKQTNKQTNVHVLPYLRIFVVKANLCNLEQTYKVFTYFIAIIESIKKDEVMRVTNSLKMSWFPDSLKKRYKRDQIMVLLGWIA